MANTIELQVYEPVRKVEALAAAAITPGYLLERNSAGKLAKHSTAGKNAAAIFAVENINGDGIDHDYAADETVQAIHCLPGDRVNALLAANASAVTIGAFLESAGDGTLRVLTTDAATDDTQRNAVVAQAVEAVDNSAGASKARIKVEVV